MSHSFERSSSGNYLIKRTDGSGSVQKVPFGELFSSSFMSSHTSYGSFDAMLSDTEMDVMTKADFVDLTDDDRDELVSRHTPFDDWLEMQAKAWQEWDQRQAGT